MKKFNISIAGILIILMVFSGSCKKWIDPEINVDPNKPTDVSLNTLLPAAEAGMGYALGGDVKYACNIWMQQLSGSNAQPLAYDKYVFTQSDADNMWKWGLYAGPMMDCKVIIDKSKEAGQECPWYGGMGKILMANMLGAVTDLWGDAPYAEAFLGEENLSPAYETQEQLYVTINTLLDEAIADLSQPEDANTFVPGGEDLIYGGNPVAWTMAAYALKARFALHLSKRQPAAYSNALAALTNAFTSNNQDFELYFGGATNENNPMYQFWNERGNIVCGYYLVNELLSTLPTPDPRLPMLVEADAGSYYGSHAGLEETGCYPGPFYASANSPVPFISYVECKFIEAECLLPTDPAGAAAAYNEGVIASCAKMGVTDVAWEAVNANETGATITLEKIMTGKYFALCYQLEVFNDWRRTGFPVLTIAANNSTSEIPRHYPYPTSEVQYNSEHCPSASLTTHVWWDL